MLHAIRRTSSNLTLQVIVALCAGAALGVLWPGFAVSLQALSDTFIKLIKMVIPPIAFLTIGLDAASVYVSHPMQNKTTAELHLSADLAFPAILQAITAEADLTPRSEAA